MQLISSIISKSGSNDPAVDVMSVAPVLPSLPSVVVTENAVVNAPTVTVVVAVPRGLPGLWVTIIRRSPFLTIVGVLASSPLLTT